MLLCVLALHYCAVHGLDRNGGIVDLAMAKGLDPSWPAAKWLEMVHDSGGAWSYVIENGLRRLGSTDREGQLLASMSPSMCGFNYAAGASVATGILVEFGTWAGGSMRCFAGQPNLTCPTRQGSI